MTAAIVHREDLSALPFLNAAAWRNGLVGHVRAGRRPVTLFATRRTDVVQLTAVLRELDGSLMVLRTAVDAHHGYHALTADIAAFHCFEREVHEQSGVRLTGHPWLKPVRKGDHAYYRVDGKEVHEVAVGPIHAGVIEPGAFRFSCLGEQVHHLEIQLGYQHRGVEEMLLRSADPSRLGPLIETVAGDTSVAHAWAWCAAIEHLTGISLTLEEDVARAVLLELERIAMHLAGLAGLATDIGFAQGAATYGRLRTAAINATMLLTGSRFGRGAFRPGRLRIQDAGRSLRRVHAELARMLPDLQLIDARFLGSCSVQHRLQGVGIVSASQALELGLVGMAARSSGLPIDARNPARAGAFHAMPIASRVFTHGDCWARARLRIAELGDSLAWILRAVEACPAPDLPVRPPANLAANQLVISLVEGWRGEVVHCVETDPAGRLVLYKVQDPSLRNWMGLAQAVRGNEISDFPICNKSFDLSYCGNDL